MVLLEKLSNNNLDKFKELSTKKLINNTYDKDFFKYYENENFISKILLKKFVKLFVYDDKIVGYMWYNLPLESPVKIWSLYVEPEYVEYIDVFTLKDFDNQVLSYEESNDKINSSVLKRLGFISNNETFLMNIDLSLYSMDPNIYNKEDQSLLKKINIKYGIDEEKLKVSCRKFQIGKDEKIRCSIQNKIFREKDRLEIDEDDIINDLKQDYYIEDLAIFIVLNGITIGYGQVIYSREMHTVVNFGIIPEFRGKGFGKILLSHILMLCKEKGIDELFIRVNSDNYQALNLYKSVGFKYKFAINIWQRCILN